MQEIRLKQREAEDAQDEASRPTGGKSSPLQTGGVGLLFSSSDMFIFKGKFRQSFYRPSTGLSFKRQFSLKSPKVGKKSAKKGPKVTKEGPDVLRPYVGIH